MNRGCFICFEGVDNAGKTTHCQLLCDRLRQTYGPQNAISFAFPDLNTFSGQLIQAYKNGERPHDNFFHVLQTQNRRDRMPDILKHLQIGHNVIVDRYAFSGYACAMVHRGSECAQLVRNLDVGLPQPDVVFYLTVPQHEARMRAINANKPCDFFEEICGSKSDIYTASFMDSLSTIPNVVVLDTMEYTKAELADVIFETTCKTISTSHKNPLQFLK